MNNMNDNHNKSAITIFKNILIKITVFINHTYKSAIIVIIITFAIAIALLIKKFHDNGFSPFDKKTDIKVSSQYYETGMEYWEQADYLKAEENLLLALKETTKSKGSSSLETAEVSQKLGALYLEMDKYEECYDFLNSSYVTFRKELGKEDGNTIIAKCQISVYDIKTGKIERGFAALNEAFDQTNYFMHKIQIAQMIAQCNIFTCNYTKALKWYDTLENLYTEFGITNLATVNFYNAYAILFLDLSQYEQAVNSLLTAITYWQSLNTKEDSTILNIYANLAYAYSVSNQYEKAITAGEKVISIGKSFYGENNIHLARAYESIADVYGNLQMPKKQLDYLEQAKKTALSAVGKNHAITADIYNALGLYYDSRNQKQDAIKSYKEALEIRKNILGKNHLTTAAVYQNLSDCYNNMGQFEKSITNAQEAVSICEAIYGKDNINTAQAYTTLVWPYANMGKIKNAENRIKLALDICSKQVNTANETVAYIYQTAGYVYMRKRNFTTAEQYLKQAQTLFSNLSKEISVNTAEIYRYLGDICMEKSNYQNASDYYQNAWSIYQQVFQNDDSYESRFGSQIKNLYKNLKPKESYENWLKKWKSESKLAFDSPRTRK